MSPDEKRPTAPAPSSRRGGSGARNTLLYVYLIAAVVVVVILVAFLVANRGAVTVSWVVGSSSVSLVWLLLGAALLGLLLGLLVTALLRPERSWWLVAALIVIVVAVAAWFIFMRGDEGGVPVVAPSVAALPSASSAAPALPSSEGVVGAWKRLDGVGGGLVVSGGAGTYEVTLYDDNLRPGEGLPATLSPDGRRLTFTLPAQFSFGGGPTGPYDATLELGDVQDMATLRITAADQTTTLLPLLHVAELNEATPSAGPSAAGTPSATATPSEF